MRLARPPVRPGADVAAAGSVGAPEGAHGHFTAALVSQVGPAFCVPPNPILLGYWDRLEDRLTKLRNGMDITGARRRLPLFAAELDPADLIRRGPGGALSDDGLPPTGVELPHFRFEFLIAKAKEQAAAVQALGAALLTALDRRDSDELNDLRTTHEDQILTLSVDLRQWEYDSAAASAEALNRRRATITRRRDHYQSLVQGGLNAEEWVQRIGQQVSSAARATEATLGFLAGTLHLLPELGSPFAMKYGGRQVGESVSRLAAGTGALSDLALTASGLGAMEAVFARRAEEWRHQLAVAADELSEVEQQIAAAGRQRDSAARHIELHRRSIDHNREVFEFARSRFTSVGLYAWQAEQLQSLHREAFTAALAVAQMAERAFRFERDDVPSPLRPDRYWDSGRAGLLAGARLAGDLQTLERRYLETDRRLLEIDQSFSVAQLDPTALVALRETGRCTFTVPELFFDLVYPGQYRRRIKAVQVTIPAVTGEYTNVGATLTLTAGSLRMQPRTGANQLRPVPLPRTTAIATSTAQRDAGVWQLDFRGERFGPFEGGGAVESEWTLTLPATVRLFPYELIRDVVLRMSYTALDDAALRQEVETSQQGILALLRANGLRRAYSLRYEFPDIFERLLARPAGTVTQLELASVHLPYLLTGRGLRVTAAELAVRPTGTANAGGLALRVGGTPVTGFTPSAALSGLPSADVRAALATGLLGRYDVAVTNAGALAPDAAPAADAPAIAADKLADILLYVEFTLA